MRGQTTHNYLIIVAFHAPTISGCDYATQTIEILGKRHRVIGLALGEPITWRDIFSSNNKKHIVEKHKQYTLFRPFFFVPGQRVLFIKQLNLFISAVLLSAYVSLFHAKKKKCFWFFEPFFMPTFFRVFSSYTTVFDCVDYFLTVQQPFLSHMIFMLRHATCVFVNSFALQKQYSSYRPDVTVVPLGFAYTLFHQKQFIPKRMVPGPKRIGFVGGIDDRLDYKLLYKTARVFKNSSFVFVGKNHFSNINTPPIVQALHSLSNVVFIDEVRKADVPARIQSFDICLIPYDSRQLFNRYCFPMKAFEYFYYGKPVVSTPIEELKRFPRFIHMGKTTSEWERNIRELLSKPWPNSYKRAQRELATTNRWERKIQVMMEHIRLDQ